MGVPTRIGIPCSIVIMLQTVKTFGTVGSRPHTEFKCGFPIHTYLKCGEGAHHRCIALLFCSPSLLSGRLKRPGLWSASRKLLLQAHCRCMPLQAPQASLGAPFWSRLLRLCPNVTVNLLIREKHGQPGEPPLRTDATSYGLDPANIVPTCSQSTASAAPAGAAPDEPGSLQSRSA